MVVYFASMIITSTVYLLFTKPKPRCQVNHRNFLDPSIAALFGQCMCQALMRKWNFDAGFALCMSACLAHKITDFGIIDDSSELLKRGLGSCIVVAQLR